jgi:uncharacterized membrane protein
MNTNNKTWIILILILFIALLLRFWGIGTESYWLDEAISVRQAQEKDYNTTLNMLKEDVHLPLYISLLYVWVKIFGTSELATRLLSLIFGLAGILLCYLLTKDLFNERTALIASAIFAVSPIMIYYSQESRLYSLFVFLSLLSFYFYLKWINEQSNKNLLWYILSTSLLIYTHLFFVLVLLVQNIYALYKSRSNLTYLIKWFSSQIMLFIIFLPWMSHILRQANNSTLHTVWIPKPNNGIILSSFMELIGNKFILGLFIICLVYFIVGRKYNSSDKDKILFLLCYLIVPFIIVISYSYIGSSVYNTRYMLFTLPAFFVVFSLIIEKVSEKNMLLLYGLVGIIIILSLMSVAAQTNRLDKDDWRSVSLYISKNVKDNENLFINPFYHQDPFTYYFDSSCFKYDDIYSCNYNNYHLLSLRWDAFCCNDSTILTATDDQNLLKDYLNNTLWLISVRERLYAAPLYDYFNENMNLTVSKEFGDIKIYKFEKS